MTLLQQEHVLSVFKYLEGVSHQSAIPVRVSIWDVSPRTAKLNSSSDVVKLKYTQSQMTQMPI